MAEATKRPEETENRSSSKSVLQGEIKQGFAREIALYEDFFRKVTEHAKTHRQISINNLNEADRRLQDLKGEAGKVADSIFFHDEETIVERARIVADTETLVQSHNRDILENDPKNMPETLLSADYLSKALLQVKYDFLAFYSRSYLNNVLSTEDYFTYFMQKSQAFQQILDKHQNEIYELFVQLDTQIKSMDDAISNIIRLKNRKVSDIQEYFEREASHYVDNQLSFSAESDSTSVEIQALMSDKVHQFNAFCDHTTALNLKIQKAMEDDYADLYRKVLNHLLQSRSFQIINKFDLFEDPQRYKAQYKRDLLNAEASHSHDESRLLSTYQKICKWQKEIRKAEAKAAQMLAGQAKRKAEILRLSEETNLRTINRLELYLNEYLEVMKIDPFLAQTIGDEASKIIKDELARISLLRLNKELKTNIDFDIQATKIKSQINELEIVLTNAIKKQLAVQEGELISELQKIPLFLAEKRQALAKTSLSLLKERHLVERLEKAADEHLAYLLASDATSRKWTSVVSDMLVKYTREKETHNIYVVEAKSELELALKEYRIKALHFQTMFENEKNYLIMQKSRVDEGTKVNNEFILTTYLNQMRFAQEQISLADSEYRVRLDSLMKTIDQERKFHEDQMAFVKNRYESGIRLIQDDYQAKLYTESHRLQQLDDRKEQKLLAVSLEKERRLRDQKVNLMVQKMNDDQVIAKSKAALSDLDARLEAAIADADALREATIKEFSGLYDRAKERYDTLKPYMDNAVNILDPTFYTTLESINGRHLARLKEAEEELDAKAEALLPSYRQTFFAEDRADHSAEFSFKIQEITAEREANEASYRQKLQLVEDAYTQKLAALAREESLLEADTASVISALQAKDQAALAASKTAILAIEKEGEERIRQHRDKTAKTINALSEEYAASLRSSKGTQEELVLDFKKVLAGYDDYRRFSEKDSGFRRILRRIRRQERKRLRAGLRGLDAKFRKYRIDAKK